MSEDELREAVRLADEHLGAVIDRLYVSDPEFKEALDRSLRLSAEGKDRGMDDA